MEKGEKFMIHLPQAEVEVEAEVRGNEADNYGSYVRFSVNGAWFPEAYQPPYLTSDTPVEEGPSIEGATDADWATATQATVNSPSTVRTAVHNHTV